MISLDILIRRYTARSFRRNGGSVRATAKALRISRHRVYRLIDVEEERRKICKIEIRKPSTSN